MSARPPSLPPDDFPEKRTFRRYALWFPVTLSTSDTKVWAICRDASAGGVQISSITSVAVGTKVTAHFRVSRYGKSDRVIDASIVRSETNDGELMLAFPFQLGLRFATPVPELPEELADQIGVASG